MDLSFKKKLSSQRKENTRFFNILNRLNHKTLDESIHSIHEEVFKNTNHSTHVQTPVITCT